MFKLLHNCTHLTHQQTNAQNPPSEVSTICELRTFRCSSWFRKGRGTRDQISNSHWIIEKAREFQKTIYFCFMTMPKALTVWITTTCGNSSRVGNSRPPYLPPEKSVCSQEATLTTGHGAMDRFQIGKGVHQVCILSPCLFSLYSEYIMRDIGLQMKHKLESRLPGEIITSDTQKTPLISKGIK